MLRPCALCVCGRACVHACVHARAIVNVIACVCVGGPQEGLECDFRYFISYMKKPDNEVRWHGDKAREPWPQPP